MQGWLFKCHTEVPPDAVQTTVPRPCPHLTGCSEYESQPDLLARLAGLDYQAAWDWLVREHNAARGQRQMSDFLRGVGGEGGRR